MAEIKASNFAEALTSLSANFLGATVDVIVNDLKGVTLTDSQKRAVQLCAAAAIAGGRKVASSKFGADFSIVSNITGLSLNGKANMRRLTVIGLAFVACSDEKVRSSFVKKIGTYKPSELISIEANTEQKKILKQAVIDSGLTDDNAATLIALFN
jgi:hypothetical protein